MSIFSKKKKAAEQGKKAAAEAEANKPRPASYFHTPTHAARDFLSSTPSSYASSHRAQILEQHNHRRSLMTRTWSEQGGKAPMSGTSTPAKRSSSQISSSGSMMADYPPVITVQRTRPNPFLPASAQPNYDSINEVPPMPTMPHRYSSSAAPRVENKSLAPQRPFPTSQKAGYIRSPLSTSKNSVEGDDESTVSSIHSSIHSSTAPSTEPSIQPSTQPRTPSHPSPQTSTHSTTSSRAYSTGQAYAKLTAGSSETPVAPQPHAYSPQPHAYSTPQPDSYSPQSYVHSGQPNSYSTAPARAYTTTTTTTQSRTTQSGSYPTIQSSTRSSIPSQAPQLEPRNVRENGQAYARLTGRWSENSTAQPHAITTPQPHAYSAPQPDMYSSPPTQAYSSSIPSQAPQLELRNVRENGQAYAGLTGRWSENPTTQPHAITQSDLYPVPEPHAYSSSIPSQAPQLELKKVRENGHELYRTYAKTPVFEISDVPPPHPAPLAAPGATRQFQKPPAEVQATKPATNKKERRRSLFGFGGFGGKKSAVEAV